MMIILWILSLITNLLAVSLSIIFNDFDWMSWTNFGFATFSAFMVGVYSK